MERDTPLGCLKTVVMNCSLGMLLSVSSISLFVYFSLFVDCKLSWLAWTQCLGFSWILRFAFVESWLSGHPSWPVSHFLFFFFFEWSQNWTKKCCICDIQEISSEILTKNFNQSSFNLICCAFDSLQYYHWSFIFLLFLSMQVFFLQVLFNYCLMHMGSSRINKTGDVCLRAA